MKRAELAAAFGRVESNTPLRPSPKSEIALTIAQGALAFGYGAEVLWPGGSVLADSGALASIVT